MPGPKEPWYKRVYDWLERRVQLEGPVKDAVLHPVPRSTASWWYVFGSASLVLLILQVVTGIMLALVYTSVGGACVEFAGVAESRLPLGWFLRAMHGWGSNFMVAVVLIHMAQVFLVRRVQVSARADMDCRRVHAADDPGHGVYRAGAAL